jgi:hypothetical protein
VVSYLAFLVLFGQWHWLRIQYFFVPKACISLEPTLVMSRANGLGSAVLGILSVWAIMGGRLGPAGAALHPRIALWEAILVGFGAAAKRLRKGALIRADFFRVLGAELVVLLEALVMVLEALVMVLMARVVVLVALVVVSFVTWVAAALNVDVALDVLMRSTMLVDVNVGVLDVARWSLVVAFNPNVALLNTSGAGIALDEDLTLDSLGGVLGCLMSMSM